MPTSVKTYCFHRGLMKAVRASFGTDRALAAFILRTVSIPSRTFWAAGAALKAKLSSKRGAYRRSWLYPSMSKCRSSNDSGCANCSAIMEGCSMFAFRVGEELTDEFVIQFQNLVDDCSLSV